MKRGLKLERKAAMIEIEISRARREGGCEVCFKPYDPSTPSCNNPRCVARWNQRRAAASLSDAATKEASQP